jgi:hypothetical protein
MGASRQCHENQLFEPQTVSLALGAHGTHRENTKAPWYRGQSRGYFATFSIEGEGDFMTTLDMRVALIGGLIFAVLIIALLALFG